MYHIWQPFVQPGQLTWLHMHGLSFTPKSWAKFLAFMCAVHTYDPLPEATQSTTVRIKFVLPVSSLPSLVETWIGAMRASTSVIFAPGFNMLHDINLREIFECAHLKFTVSGLSMCNPVTLVWGSLRFAPITILKLPFFFRPHDHFYWKWCQ